MPFESLTYDEKQAGAVLVRCATCRREFFMTKPCDVCLCCRMTRASVSKVLTTSAA